MGIKCSFHPDKEAIMECKNCKRQVCLEDCYIFIDKHNRDKGKLFYCVLCYNNYYDKSFLTDSLMSFILLFIGLILVFLDFFKYSFFGFSVIQLIGLIAVLLSIGLLKSDYNSYLLGKNQNRSLERNLSVNKGFVRDELDLLKDSSSEKFAHLNDPEVCERCGNLLVVTDDYCQHCGKISITGLRKQWDEFNES